MAEPALLSHMSEYRFSVDGQQCFCGRSLPRRLRRFGSRSLLIALVVVVANTGCRRQETTPPPSAPGDRTTSPSSDALPNVLATRRSLTQQQRAAVKRIVDAGGAVEYDQSLFPVTIDLASDRVFANDDVVLAVLQFPGLIRLRLAVSNATGETLSKLASLRELQELLLQDARLTDHDLSQILSEMPALERLTLRRLSQVTDGIASALVKLPKLQILALIEMNQIAGVTLDQLHTMLQLRSLDLRNCGGLSAEDLQKLSGTNSVD